jgi:hypothetical protein
MNNTVTLDPRIPRFEQSQPDARDISLAFLYRLNDEADKRSPPASPAPANPKQLAPAGPFAHVAATPYPSSATRLVDRPQTKLVTPK